MLKKYIKKYWLKYLMGIIVLFAVDILSLYVPQFTGEVTDGLGNQTLTIQGVSKLCLLIFLTGLGMAAGRFGWRYFLFVTARKIEKGMRDDLFEHLSTLSLDYYNNHKTGDLMAHFTNDIASVRVAIGPAVISTFDAIVMTVMVLAKMILYVDLKLTVISCIPMLLILFGAIWYGSLAQKVYTEKNDAFSLMSDKVQESFSGVRVIKAFVQEKKELASFLKVNKKNLDKTMKVVKLNTVFMPSLDFVIGVCRAITLLYGGWLVYQSRLSLGQFVAFNQYIGMLVWPMIAAGDSINAFSQGRASIGRIKKIMSAKPDITDTGADSTIDRLEGEISIKNLSFAYPQQKTKVLNNINVEIPKGSTLAIIGHTGCGKTTLVNLLIRMYETGGGSICFDGHDIKDIPLKVLRNQIAYVPQDNFLFSDTVQANIAFGVRGGIKLEDTGFSLRTIGKSQSELSRMLEEDQEDRYERTDKAYNDLDEVIKAAQYACVHDNIVEFPRKYATIVGERGVTMSGGQKQRSSIARALMKDAPILILDDSLSAVDTDTEERILANLKENRKDRTTIIIAHRISTIQNADHILVLADDGSIKEYGSHEELMKLGGTYERLYEKQQLEKMIDEVV